MTRINQLTDTLCAEIESRMASFLKPLAAEYGLNFSMLKGNLYPDGTTFAARCQLSVPERRETVASEKEEEDFICYAESFGMRSEWLGRTFERGNFTYKVAGLRISAPKECAILERSDGSRCYENGALVSKYLA